MYQYYHSWSYCTPPDWLQSGILPLTAGSLLAGPNYEVRPRILPNYYLVCITGGTGRMQMGGKEFRIGDGELFTLFPHVVHSYQTDPNNLLKMFWIGFSGSSVKAILKNAEIYPDNPIVKYENRADLSNALQKLSKVSCEDSLSGYLNACSRLLEVFGVLLQGKTVQGNLRQRAALSPLATIAHNHINTHYAESISVADLSRQLGVSRVTLTKLFHAELGQTPAEYIQYVRMKHAVMLLNQTEFPIHEIARRVGYSDALYFSKVFSRNYGVSPSRFRALSYLANTQPF